MGDDIERLPLLESPDTERFTGVVFSDFASKKARVFATEELEPLRLNSWGSVEDECFGSTTDLPGDPFPDLSSWVEPLGVGELEALSLSSS